MTKVAFMESNSSIILYQTEEGELEEISTCRDFLQVQKEGNRQIERNQTFYNLDVIISVGYRVKSHRGMLEKSDVYGRLD